MEAFYKAYKRMKRADPQRVIRRDLMDKIDRDDRLICIRGPRGIGKTRFLLDFAQEHWPAETSLYVNMNHFYFSVYALTDFAKEFSASGGKVLLLDQIFKYPQWVSDLEKIHRELPDLTIVFSTSSVMTLDEDFGALKEIIRVYDLHGFSFREFLNYHSGLDFKPIRFEDLLRHHRYYASQVVSELHPHDYLPAYLTQGYYPPEVDNTLFGELLVKNLNMLLEVDIVYIRQIDPSYLHKLRQLLYVLATDKQAKPNITKLSEAIGASRATVMNYLRYLSDAGMIRLLYKGEATFPRKPDSVFINDTNILNAIYPHEPTNADISKVFVLSHVQNAGLSVEISEVSSADLVIDRKHHIKTLPHAGVRSRNDTYYVLDDIMVGDQNRIPLWLFGFLY